MKKTKFFWGAANAAFQVEGSPEDSDWRRWTRNLGNIKDSTDAEFATHFLTRYSEDFHLARELGSNAFRISIAWERVMPSDGHFDEKALDRYEAMAIEMRLCGLEPMITLHHFVTPGWLIDQGGICGPRFLPAFIQFAERVFQKLNQGPAQVKWWITINEPMVLVSASYLAGEWPPQKKSPWIAMKVAAQLARAHLAVVKIFRALDPTAFVSVACHWRDFQPASNNFLDRWATRFVAWAFNDQFINSVLSGKIFFWMPGSAWISERQKLPLDRAGLDYIGLNYYGRTLVGFKFTPPFLVLEEGAGVKTDLGWEIYPAGLGRVLQELDQKFNLPVLITENGLADAVDSRREKFIFDHIEEIKKARKAGIQVCGYLYWSLTDNFEWAFGLTPKFGLIEIDYSSGTRKPRSSFAAYKKLISENQEI